MLWKAAVWLSQKLLYLNHARPNIHISACMMQVQICTAGAENATDAAQGARGVALPRQGEAATLQGSLLSTHANLMLLAWGALIPGAVIYATRKTSSWCVPTCDLSPCIQFMQ